MTGVSTSTTTFNQIFGWIFNNPNQPATGLRVIPELALSEIEQGAIGQLQDYCKKHELPLNIESIRENTISIKVTV
ncbi:hypothetical protein [Acinetobacter sp. GN11]